MYIPSIAEMTAWMQIALEQAEHAAQMGEVPVGAVIVHEQTIISARHNLRETQNDPTAHAEILALQEASRVLQRWRLHDCTLVCTLEPCPMCAGALVHARVGRVIYGVQDPRTGAAGSVYSILQSKLLNHRIPAVHTGILQNACQHILQTFFARRRDERLRSHNEK